MELFIRKDNGNTIQVKEMTTLDKDCKMLFFFIQHIVKPDDIRAMEEVLSEKTGKKAIVLDARFSETILGS